MKKLIVEDSTMAQRSMFNLLRQALTKAELFMEINSKRTCLVVEYVQKWCGYAY